MTREDLYLIRGFFVGFGVALLVVWIIFSYWYGTGVEIEADVERRPPAFTIIEKDKGMTVYIINHDQEYAVRDNGGNPVDYEIVISKLIESAEKARKLSCDLFGCSVERKLTLKITYNKGLARGATTYNFPNLFGNYDILIEGLTLNDIAAVMEHEMGHIVCYEELCKGKKIPIGVDEATNGWLMEGALINAALKTDEVHFGAERLLTSAEYPGDKSFLIYPPKKDSPLYPKYQEFLRQANLFNSNAASLLIYLLLEEGGFDNWVTYLRGGVASDKGYTKELFASIYKNYSSFTDPFFEIEKNWRLWLALGWKKEDLQARLQEVMDKRLGLL